MEIKLIDEYPGHIPLVAEWLYNEWIWRLPNGSVSLAQSILTTMPDIFTGLPVAFIAIQNFEPVGVARLTIHDMDTRKEISPWLANVYVPTQHRNKGVGTALCKTVIMKAYELGFKDLYLFTPDQESFYLRQGWKTIEVTTHRNEPVVIMKIKTSERVH